VRKFPSGDARKMSLYFPQDMAEHVAAQAIRLDRSKSWVVQTCVRLSKAALEQMEGAPDDEAWPRESRKVAEGGAKMPQAEAEPVL